MTAPAGSSDDLSTDHHHRTGVLDTMNADLDSITTTEFAATIGALLAELAPDDSAIESIDVTGHVVTVELLNGQVFTLTASPATDTFDEDDEAEAQAAYDNLERCAHGYIVGSCLADCDDDDLDGFDAFGHVPDADFA